eukprot:10530915-Lingulodinium_polyedra.AAC.1
MLLPLHLIASVALRVSIYINTNKHHGASARSADATACWRVWRWKHKAHHAQARAVCTYTTTLTFTDATGTAR